MKVTIENFCMSDTVYPDHITVYIPSNLDIDKLIEENPPDFSKFHRDNLIYILSLIHSIPSRNKKIQDKMKNGFTPVKKKYLQDCVRAYRSHIDYLIKLDVILEDRQYIKKKFAGSIKFTEKYLTELVPIDITKDSIIKYVLDFQDGRRERADKLFPYLTKWFDSNLVIDMDGAESCLMQLYEEDLKEKGQEKAINSFVSNHNSLLRLASGEFRLSVDKAGGRFHSNLTNLKKELRSFISYNGEKLGNVDLKNSQPYLLQAIFDPKPFQALNIEEKIKEINPNFSYDPEKMPKMFRPNFEKFHSSLDGSIPYPDVLKFTSGSLEYTGYRQLTRTGSIYETHGKEIMKSPVFKEEKTLADEYREIAKKSMYKVLFSHNNASNPDIEAFKKTYPLIYHFVYAIKEGKTNTLAILLQWVESQMMLGRVCKELSEKYPDLPLFTIHDSIATYQSHLEVVVDQIEESFRPVFGDVPKVGIKKWG